jgi:hypothetical protein
MTCAVPKDLRTSCIVIAAISAFPRSRRATRPGSAAGAASPRGHHGAADAPGRERSFGDADQASRNTARRLREHGEQAAADALPATCPYTLDQITGDWLP